MKKNTLLFIIISLFSFGIAIAQNNQGSLDVIVDEKIEELSVHYKALNENNPGLNGYRIQIYFDSGNQSKQNALEAKTKFENRNIDEEAYVLFEDPYYKVRIGDFRTKVEAEGFLKHISNIYPEGFVVPDYINFPKLYDKNGVKIDDTLNIEE